MKFPRNFQDSSRSFRAVQLSEVSKKILISDQVVRLYSQTFHRFCQPRLKIRENKSLYHDRKREVYRFRSVYFQYFRTLLHQDVTVFYFYNGKAATEKRMNLYIKMRLCSISILRVFHGEPGHDQSITFKFRASTMTENSSKILGKFQKMTT